MDSVGKCPTIARGGGGWAQLELTDELQGIKYEANEIIITKKNK